MKEKSPNSTVYRSVDELAEILGLSRISVYKALKAGKIPSIRLGKRFVLPRAAIQKWLDGAGKPVCLATFMISICQGRRRSPVEAATGR
jgi:excisionase family DNA binding protein